MKHLFLISFLLLFSISLLNAEEYIVIVNKSSNITSVSTAELKRLYTGKLDQIAGSKTKPINLALDNPAAVAFLKNNLGMEVADYKSFWLAEQVRGGSSAPGIQKTTEGMIAFISTNNNAIGYVPAGTSVDAVKTVTVKD